MLYWREIDTVKLMAYDLEFCGEKSHVFPCFEQMNVFFFSNTSLS